MIPVASIYRSTHLEMQLLSLPPRLEPGFVTHFSKHFLPTVCKIKCNREMSAIRHSTKSLLKVCTVSKKWQYSYIFPKICNWPRDRIFNNLKHQNKENDSLSRITSITKCNCIFLRDRKPSSL